MKTNILLVAVSAWILGGCSSTPSKVDTGTIKANTFSFVNTGGRPAPSFADDREAVHKMIQKAVAQNFAGKGVAQAPAGSGDITVAYLVIVGNNASTAAISDYFGLGRDAQALQEKAHTAYTGNKNPNYFEAGTLVIDIVDTKSFQLLKRNYVTREILRNATADVRALRIQEAVDECLRDLRVARK